MLHAAARVLRPLVRALLRSGVTFPVLADMLRGLYVDVAHDEIAAEGRPRTDSRLSLLTGIHRKELRRQRSEPHTDAEPEVVTLHSRVIGRWLGDPAYQDRSGAAAALARSGPAPSFEALVAGVTKDVHARSILDELVAQGLVSVDADKTVHLQTQAYLPSEAGEAKLYYFARNLHDHAAAAAANILSAPAPFMERSVHYDDLSPEAAASLERAAREAAERTLLDVNRTALGLSEADAAGGRRRRVNFGVYVYVEDEPDA